ncbi:AraC family transcriptional regulator [Chitinophaga oryzae]|uniref:AraC family transcriptional regulator n=1 Tax=Chitinophaga oryzae TaxID=2725414 RepID=A0ABX6L8P1_9BACT|nr:helix-turn-helix domain-containing protein [Chitinophaga oryzae]QJB36372.1 AraC family transcriptional regulator [Chitinophaga oryzae]
MDALLIKTSYLPPFPLRPYIDRFWTCEGTAAAYAQPTMAMGTGAEMIFQLKAPMTIVSNGNMLLTPPPQAIYCVRHQHYRAMINNTHRFVAVRFKAGAIRHFCPLPVTGIIECFPDVHLLYGDEGQRLTEGLQRSKGTAQQLELISVFLSGLLRKYHRPHVLTDEAVRRLYHHRELPDMIAFSAALGSSYRQFERLFIQHVGVTPKAFQQAARLNNTLKYLLFRGIHNYLPVAFDFGYYDQSHFIRACRKYFGDKPRAILSPTGCDHHFYLSSCSASGLAERK